MFILDLIRDYNLFSSQTLVQFHLSPLKSKETLETICDILEKYRKQVLYVSFTDEEKAAYKSRINADEETLAMVAKM